MLVGAHALLANGGVMAAVALQNDIHSVDSARPQRGWRVQVLVGAHTAGRRRRHGGGGRAAWVVLQESSDKQCGHCQSLAWFGERRCWWARTRCWPTAA